MNFIPFSTSSFAWHFLAGLLRCSYVSHHYRANPSMTMFNYLWGIWSAVGRFWHPVAQHRCPHHTEPEPCVKRENHLKLLLHFCKLGSVVQTCMAKMELLWKRPKKKNHTRILVI